MKSLIVLRELTELTQEELKQHYVEVCEALKIDTRLRPLAYFEQIGYSGKRTLILYTLRGGANLIGAAQGVSTTVSFEGVAEGTIMFKGTASKGSATTGSSRSIQTIGAANILGLTGKDKEDAIMTAQTKATRRAILDITGSGLLDETEIEGMHGTMIEVDPGIGADYKPQEAAPIPSAVTATEIIEPETISIKVAVAEFNAAIDTVVHNAAIELGAITEEEITKRLNAYRRDTLQSGGMRPSKGFGIAAKWGKFISKNAPNKTAAEYAALLSTLDAIKVRGDSEVVAEIERQIA
jgi:hypothetical protein